MYTQVMLCKTRFRVTDKACSVVASWAVVVHAAVTVVFDIWSECISVHAPLLKCQANDSSWSLIPF